MTELHTHDWIPIPGQCACYSCACGTTGCRASNGLIHEVRHATELRGEAELTARPIADYRTGRVRAHLRMMEEEDFWDTQQQL